MSEPTILSIPTEKLRPDPNNVRRHGDACQEVVTPVAVEEAAARARQEEEAPAVRRAPRSECAGATTPMRHEALGAILPLTLQRQDAPMA